MMMSCFPPRVGDLIARVPWGPLFGVLDCEFGILDRHLVFGGPFFPKIASDEDVAKCFK